MAKVTVNSKVTFTGEFAGKPVSCETVKIDRFRYGDYIIEMEKTNSHYYGDGFDFWLYRDGFGVKHFICGFPVDQYSANGKRHYHYSCAEILQLVFSGIDDVISSYRKEYEEK